MTWFKLDDKCAFHSKIIAAGNDAFGAWCRAGAWSAGELLDGFIPEHMALMIGPRKLWTKLELCGGPGRAGLVEKVEGGWKIHDFSDWNPPADEIRAAQDARREHARMAARSRWNGSAAGNAPSMPRACPEHQEEQCPNDAPGRCSAYAMRARDPVPSRPVRSDPTPTPPASGKGAGRKSIAAPLPDDFTPDATAIEAARRYGRDLEAVCDSMRDWAKSKGEKRADWQATLRTFLRKAQERGESPASGASEYREIKESSEPVSAARLLHSAPPEAQQALGELFGRRS